MTTLTPKQQKSLEDAGKALEEQSKSHGLTDAERVKLERQSEALEAAASFAAGQGLSLPLEKIHEHISNLRDITSNPEYKSVITNAYVVFGGELFKAEEKVTKVGVDAQEVQIVAQKMMHGFLGKDSKARLESESVRTQSAESSISSQSSRSSSADLSKTPLLDKSSLKSYISRAATMGQKVLSQIILGKKQNQGKDIRR